MFLVSLVNSYKGAFTQYDLSLFTFFYSTGGNLLKTKLQTSDLQTGIRYKYVLKSVLIEFAPSKQQKVNKHPKFDYNFSIQRQLEHFEYEMNLTL